MVREAIDQVEMALAETRLESARAGAFAGNMSGNVRQLDTSSNTYGRRCAAPKTAQLGSNNCHHTGEA